MTLRNLFIVLYSFLLLIFLSVAFPFPATAQDAHSKLEVCQTAELEAFRTTVGNYDNSIGFVGVDAPKGIYTGVGFKVAEDLILTAAHVVAEDGILPMKIAKNIRFFPKMTLTERAIFFGVKEASEEAGVALKIEVVKIGRPLTVNDDWAILRVSSKSKTGQAFEDFKRAPVVPILPWSSRTKKIRAYGFPQGCEDQEIFQLASFTGETRPLSFSLGSSEKFSAYLKGANDIIKFDNALDGYEMEGMSGGPVFVVDPNTGTPLYCVGVLSKGGHQAYFATSAIFLKEIYSILPH